MIFKNRSQSGFSLVELMVVILILGIVMTVLAVAVFPNIFRARANLDAGQLSKFATDFATAAEDKKAAARNIGKEKGSFIDLVKELFKQKIIVEHQVQMLAGASGTKPTDVDVQNGRIDTGTGSSCIFTGPSTSNRLIQSMKMANVKVDGILMSSNKNNYKSFPDYGIIVLFPGSTLEAHPLQPVQIEKQYNDSNPQHKATFNKDLKDLDPDFYGKPPFQNIVPE